MKENVAQITRNNVIPSAVDPNTSLNLTTNPKNEQDFDDRVHSAASEVHQELLEEFSCEVPETEEGVISDNQVQSEENNLISDRVKEKVILQSLHIDNISRNQSAILIVMYLYVSSLV